MGLAETLAKIGEPLLKIFTIFYNKNYLFYAIIILIVIIWAIMIYGGLKLLGFL